MTPEESVSAAIDGTDAISDADLISATRNGDAGAFGQLYARHVEAAGRLSRVLVKDRAAADDLVSEAFEKVLAAIRNGKGPETAFRAYLLTTLRNTFFTRVKRDGKVEFTSDISVLDHGEPFDDPAVAGQERTYAARAYRKLPQRWQAVLWHMEVEGESAASTGALLGLSPNAVSALAYRARERLKELYLQAHIEDAPAGTCRWVSERLGAKVRGGLSNRDTAKVNAHLDDCSGCTLLYLNLTEVNSGIGVLIAPVVVGLSAPAYLAASTTGTAATTWLASWTAWITSPFSSTGWIGRLWSKPAGRNSLLGGTATAALVGALILILVANSTTPAPPADASSPPPTAPTNPSSEDPSDDEPPAPPTDDPDTPTDEPTEEATPPPKDTPTTPADYSIDLSPGQVDLVAGNTGTLPFTLNAGKPSTTNRVPAIHRQVPVATEPHQREKTTSNLSLTVTFPAGITATGSSSDGWACTTTPTDISCQGPTLEPGESTTVMIEISIDRSIAGYQEATAVLTAGDMTARSTVRFPVAPPSKTTAYASTTASGISNAGNTFLSCALTKWCQHGLADNHVSLLGPYRTGLAPNSVGKDSAVSGATLSVPSGAEIVWAGLYWAGSGRAPESVTLLTPDGRSLTVAGERSWSGEGLTPAKQYGATITQLIHGPGQYLVAADTSQLPSGLGQYAGWSLTVVYEQQGSSPHETAVYEGLNQLGFGGSASFDIPNGDTEVAYTLWEGDRTLKGDTLSIAGAVPCGGNNIASSYSASALEGADWHTFGVDVGTCHSSAPAGTVTITAGGDPIDIGVVAIATIRG